MCVLSSEDALSVAPPFTPLRHRAILRMISAISHHPDMVYGTNGFCTELMKEFSGKVIGKRGAAGVYLTGIVGEGIGCAVKLEDGSMGPQYNITMELIHWLVRRQKLTEQQTEEENQLSRGNVDDPSSSTGPGPGSVTVERKLQNLERFRVTPSYNSMGVLVGHTRCVKRLFPLKEQE
jgi:hypothetical protein